MIAKTPKPPYYAVIFSNIRTKGDHGYSDMGAKMLKMASEQPGYLGVESAKEELGITVSYWKDLDSIKKWKANIDHKVAQEKGKSVWYQSFKTRIAKIERDYEFEK